ncbi:unnamed protein product [Cylindrotheca closterium]|uniref:F-box/LRR-repeat protein 15-like leucin rich repeat domain-containing protein n=1 Tax=Cylindrotheca closterium TaxID=2856 RepID=A0AAD2FUV5_9STRA|nr:unnamed protein product [Cylindrotheca closterium]
MSGDAGGNDNNKNVTTIKIISATYGPCEGLQLSTGESTSDFKASFPHTRDVSLFLQALLLIHAATQAGEAATSLVDENAGVISDRKRSYGAAFSKTKKPPPAANTAQPNMNLGAIETVTTATPFVFLLGNGGKLAMMNAIFGDPCPGTSKRLKVHYLVCENAVTEIHHDTFAEHEQVFLRQRLRLFQSSDSQLQEDQPSTAKNTSSNIKAGNRNQHRATRGTGGTEQPPLNSRDDRIEHTSPLWTLHSDTSEIILPLVLPFLKLSQRVACRLVCNLWKSIVKDWGVATTIDCNDKNIANFSRPFLRGILSHSYSSLKSLVLDGFVCLEKEDLHLSIPHLRKLESLDLSRCRNLDNSTMILLSQHIHSTLQVLYLKGLEKVSDEGVIAICNSCTKLQVLELSYVPITDKAGLSIQHLPQLRALFMRDNYRITDQSIDVITTKCIRLKQLTLWGCIKLRNLQFHRSGDKLVILNLWGCYSLSDDIALSFANMNQLTSLTVSECHRLSDQFVERLVEYVPQLRHLQMRYCKRLTDQGVETLASRLCNLYTLDLSFCTKLTADSLFHLLNVCRDSLSELRLQNCRQLTIGMQFRDTGTRRGLEKVEGSDGRLLANAIRSHHPKHSLSVLDVRGCGSPDSVYRNIIRAHSEQAGEQRKKPFWDKDPFVIALKGLDFEQKVPGFFSRQPRWSNVQRRLLEQMSSPSANSNANV